MNRFIRELRSAGILLLVAGSVQLASAASPVYATDGVAIRGYDTVAYFVDGKPVKGTDEFVTDYKGAHWKFASKDHLDKFKADPAKYAPQYGGYCAYGASLGHLAPTEPDAWAVVNDKLYLNYNQNVRAKWSQDIPGYNKKADAAFDGLLKAPAEAE